MLCHNLSVCSEGPTLGQCNGFYKERGSDSSLPLEISSGVPPTESYGSLSQVANLLFRFLVDPSSSRSNNISCCHLASLQGQQLAIVVSLRPTRRHVSGEANVDLVDIPFLVLWA